MANGNAAYKLDSYSYPSSSPERDGARVRAVRTGGASEQSASLLAVAARMAAVVIVVVAALSFARIVLTSQAVSTMIESDALSGQISDARSTGVALEMEQSVLSNPYAIKAQAAKLGMSAPAEVGSISLSPDVVAVDAGGSLSLSGTVRNVVETQG